ncbi:MAG: YggS family pyridoxal phosphate-dependent enzyme [Candidatus Endonucleobacter bathymodioli]|uniref:Pyridoxal phosphate homeostasis protein n=1 Tax=Candidatus Endonucleibacter bathymodioli TaxID=539814 RepID=A0AA90NJI0_9GAMM|nr:YggS family pyridoxal phosphate-dependent enzyme [Candidatus Endonucleobacter bathymodioli]
MTSLKKHFDQVRVRIQQAENSSNRQGKVQLLAVSKKKTAAMIREAYALGQRSFGESYVQEAVNKIKELSYINDICWHFIGLIQSNKTQDISSYFQWAHSVCRLKIAKRLSEQRPATSPPLNICLQVTTSEKNITSGVEIADLSELALAVSVLPGLKLRGLMTLPPAETDQKKQTKAFRVLAKQLSFLNKTHNLAMDTLSMGMTSDLEVAIQEGATIVRIGTALFGARV